VKLEAGVVVPGVLIESEGKLEILAYLDLVIEMGEVEANGVEGLWVSG